MIAGVPKNGSIVFESGFYYKIRWVELKVNYSEPMEKCCWRYPHPFNRIERCDTYISHDSPWSDGLKCGEVYETEGAAHKGKSHYFRDLDGKVYQIVKMQLKKIPDFPEGYIESLVTEVNKHVETRREAAIAKIVDRIENQ